MRTDHYLSMSTEVGSLILIKVINMFPRIKHLSVALDSWIIICLDYVFSSLEMMHIQSVTEEPTLEKRRKEKLFLKVKAKEYSTVIQDIEVYFSIFLFAFLHLIFEVLSFGVFWDML